jgi:Zn ribbon nucleic-acid-binding protein
MTTITMCPKCDSSNHMSWNGDYAVCLQCGYEDYNNPIPRPSPKAKGLRYLAHYIGQYTPFKGLEVPIRVKGHSTRHSSLILEITCPWCSTIMNPLTTKDNSDKYRCPAGHNVTIFNRKDGTLEWD